MTSPTDSDQNERLASLETATHTLGRSIDRVRDSLQSHEDECKENWKEQRERTTSMEIKLKLILWVAGAAAVASLEPIAQHLFSIFVGG